MLERQCKNCIHFYNTSENGTYGLCRRYPPQVVPYPTDNQHPIAYDPQPMWPAVEVTQSCGEFSLSFAQKLETLRMQMKDATERDLATDELPQLTRTQQRLREINARADIAGLTPDLIEVLNEQEQRFGLGRVKVTNKDRAERVISWLMGLLR